MTKEAIRNSNRLENAFNMMQLITINNATKVWNEITNTIGQTIAGKTEFTAEEYKEVTDDQFQNVFKIIFEKGKERKQYIDAHKNDWPDVETQLNYISNNKQVKKIFHP